MTKQESLELAQELKDKAQEWYYRNFNEININLIEKALEANGAMLIEYIEPEIAEKGDAVEWFAYEKTLDEKTESFEDYIEETGNFVNLDAWETNSEFLEWLLREYQNEIEDFTQDKENNYPMWNTLFELKSESSLIRDMARKCGFGIIEPTDYTNTMLFVSGCGYSFYGQHWISLYLSVCSGLAGKYKGVDYSMM